MKLVTVATQSERYYPYLKLSAEANGHELITLGYGEKWRGFGWRFDLMKEYLKSLDKDEIVCFIDGYDVIVLQDPATIERNFKEISKGDKTRVVVSVETPSDSAVDKFLINTWSSFFSYKCENNMVNAGTYIGYSSAIMKLFDNICKTFECKPDSDDQILVQRYCIENSDTFIFDKDSQIFLVIASLNGAISPGKDGLVVDDKKLYYKGAMPCILHAPAYSDIDDVIGALGYDSSIFKARNEDKSQYRISFMKHFAKELYNRYFIIVNILLFVLILYVVQKFGIVNLKPFYRSVSRSVQKLTKR